MISNTERQMIVNLAAAAEPDTPIDLKVFSLNQDSFLAMKTVDACDLTKILVFIDMANNRYDADMGSITFYPNAGLDICVYSNK